MSRITKACNKFSWISTLAFLMRTIMKLKKMIQIILKKNNFTFSKLFLPLTFQHKLHHVFNKCFLYFFLLICSSQQLLAQYDVPLYTPYTTEEARVKLNERLVKNTILKNLSLSLNDSTEENWQDAFNAMEVLVYKTPFTTEKIHLAFDSIEIRSISFQRALLELAYANYPGKFITPTESLLDKTIDPKIFAMCAEYMIQNSKNDSIKKLLTKKLFEKFRDSTYKNPILFMLQTRLEKGQKNSFSSVEILKEILNKNFLSNQIVMYSFQRSNRDFPGIALIRNAKGNFITDSSGGIFNVPQLARGISNLPGYLTNGNTPQGLFRMFGLGVSKSHFIGPTTNIQMGMPIEISKKKFFNDSTITDSVWTMYRYQKLIPQKLINYLPLYYSYYAGLAGRSEIIAHGTTIDPVYYSGKSYFPLTPTQGCLCTKEIWEGKRVESDQQRLINALLKAGGANGYCVVIELDDKDAAVTINELLPYLPK